MNPNYIGINFYYPIATLWSHYFFTSFKYIFLVKNFVCIFFYSKHENADSATYNYWFLNEFKEQ
jgi:hypothetical protein